MSSDSTDTIKTKIQQVFDDLVQHDGFGEFSVEMRILKRQQKEVIIHYGKQYRYIVDFKNLEASEDAPDEGEWRQGKTVCR